MTEPITRFELTILRPLWGLVIVGMLAAMFATRWCWVGGGLLALVYIGAIGSGLHPSPTAGDLPEGPLNGMASVLESRAMDVNPSRRPERPERWHQSGDCRASKRRDARPADSQSGIARGVLRPNSRIG